VTAVLHGSLERQRAKTEPELMKPNAGIKRPGNDEGDSSNSLSTLQNDFESMDNILVDLAQQDDSEDDDMLPEPQPTPTPSRQLVIATFPDASRQIPAYKKDPDGKFVQLPGSRDVRIQHGLFLACGVHRFGCRRFGVGG
jgi:hypothetical protein